VLNSLRNKNWSEKFYFRPKIWFRLEQRWPTTAAWRFRLHLQPRYHTYLKFRHPVHTIKYHLRTIRRGYAEYMLDMLAMNFDKFAIDALEWHLDDMHRNYRVTPERKELYRDLIRRLSEKRPRVCDTPEKRELVCGTTEELLARFDGENEDANTLLEDWHRRRDEYLERIHRARHDFVDVVPQLFT